MDCIINALKEFCRDHGFDKTYWIGYSGGLDSHVLLHALAALRSDYPIRLRAVYINHGLSPNAVTWAQHCQKVCDQLQIDFAEHKIHIDPLGNKSPEEAAREGRYAVFTELLASNDLLLTAHHQDDQAETVLVQMLRGAGPKGLAAMPRIKPFAKGLHARPLLDFTRQDLKHYAEAHQLSWIDDESNADVNFVRNFLRHDIIPVLQKRWPTVTTTLSRVAEHCAEAQQLLDEMAAEDLAKTKGDELDTLSIKKLLQLDSARQRHVLRAWLGQLHLPIPPTVKLQQIQHDMLHAREDKAPHFTWRDIELRRYRDTLYVMPCLIKHDSTLSFDWDLLKSASLGDLQSILMKGQGLRADINQVVVRFRQGGEVFQMPGRTYRHDLKKLFQAWGIPPWKRDRVPLIYVGKTLAAIVGFALSDEFAVRSENEEGRVIVSKPVPGKI